MTALPRATYKPVSKLWPLKFFRSCSLIWLTSGTLKRSSIYLAHPSHQIPASLSLLPTKHPRETSWAADANSTQRTVVAHRPQHTSHPATQGLPSVPQVPHRLQAAPNLGTQPPREPKARQKTLLKHTAQWQLINFSLLSIHPST